MNIPFVMRRCTKCGEWKVASTVNFYKCKNNKDGLAGDCKECRKEYTRQYNKLHKEEINEKNRQYHQLHKKEINERHRQYYQDNLDKELERVRQWRKDNPDKVAEYSRRHNKKRRQARIDAIIAQKRAEYEADRAPLVAEKTCKCCGRTLPASEFYANKNSKDHLASDCKECAKKKSQERYYHNLETKGWA